MLLNPPHESSRCLITHHIPATDTGREPVHATFFGHSLSLMSNWAQAWAAVTNLSTPLARVVVVDLAPPTRGGLPTQLAASAFAGLGGSNLRARPWQALVDTCEDIQHSSFAGGHVQVWAGTLW